MRAVLSFAVALATISAARAASVPKGTEVISINRGAGKMGGVRFTHAAHSEKYRHPDGRPTRCKDCHHNLSGDEVSTDEARTRCNVCHASVGEPARMVDGRGAVPFATLKPEGAVDYRSILFHAHCWACHRKLVKDGVPFTRCKHCHAHGVTEEMLHGRYAP